MIRYARAADLLDIMNIWLTANQEAQPFIDPEYWHANVFMIENLMKEAKFYVYHEKKEILGFAALKGGYLVAIYVKRGYRSKGIGKELLETALSHSRRLTLTVYEKNKLAIKFFEHYEFKLSAINVNSVTGQVEFQMKNTAWG